MKRATLVLLALSVVGVVGVETGTLNFFAADLSKQLSVLVSTPTSLPFYDSADFTPTWTRPAAERPFSFNLLTQRGTAVTANDLRGRVHVASFIFTRCDGICPTMMRQLRRVQQETPDDLLLVSYSVTASLDRPQDLAAFGERERVDPGRWLLVTGDESQIVRLARDFYFADDRRLEDRANAFLHTEKVLLVDGNGDLRGVYNGTVPFDMQRLIEDVRMLMTPA